MVREETTTAFTIWTRIDALFCDNQQARTGYLGKKICNLEPEGKLLTDYFREQKSIPNALANVDALVTDNTLVWNVLKGPDKDIDNVAALVLLLTMFPSFNSKTCPFSRN
jgi:hypothetical protein